jgi:hypothetical protein
MDQAKTRLVCLGARGTVLAGFAGGVLQARDEFM